MPATRIKKKRLSRGFMTPVTPDTILGAITGTNSQTRPVITKKVWDYIKEHNLQSPGDRRKINTDTTLKRICNNKRSISMFELTRHIARHFN